MATNLDRFKNDKKSEDFELNGKIYKARYTGDILLEIITNKEMGKQDEKTQIDFIFGLVFGKDNAKELVENLTTEGLQVIIDAVINGLGITASSTKK